MIALLLTLTSWVNAFEPTTSVSTTSISVSSEENAQEKYIKETRKEFISKFKELKDEFRDKMKDSESRKEYFTKRNELFKEYKTKLLEAAKMKDSEIKDRIKERMKDSESKMKELRENMKEKMEKVSKRVKEMRIKFKEKRQELRVKFKTAIEKNKRVQSRLEKIGNDKLEKLLPAIDRLIEKTENNTRISEEKINQKIATYNALKDIINQRLNNTSNDLENTVNEILK